MAFGQDRLLRLMQHRLLAGSALTILPSSLGSILTLLAIPLLTRSYSVETIGIGASVLAVALLFSVVLSLGVPQTLPSTSSATGAVLVAGVLIVAAVVLATLLAGSVQFLPQRFRVSVLGSASAGTWWIAGLAVAISANEFMMYLAVRERTYLSIGLSQFFLHAVRAGVQVTMGWMGLGWEGLVCGDIAGRFCSSAVLLFGTRKSIASALRSAQVSELKRTGREVEFGPRTIFPTTFVDMAVFYLPLLGLTALYGATAAGYYSLVTKVVEGPTGIAARHIANVFHGELAEKMRTGGSGVRSMVINSFLLVFVLAGIPVAIAALYGPTLFAVVFGEQWRTAGQGFSIFAIPCVLITATSAPTRVLVVTREVWRKFYVFAVFALGYALALGIAWMFDQTYQMAWVGLALASTVGYLIYFSAAMRAAARAEQGPGAMR